MQSSGHPNQMSSYQAERRTRQFLSQWLNLVESLKPNAEAFRPMLGEQELSLGFRGPGFTIRSFMEFASWIQQQAERMIQTRHRIDQVKVEIREGGQICAKIDFEWNGLNAAGIQVGGKLRHEWELKETGERFLRLQTARVTMLEPVEAFTQK